MILRSGLILAASLLLTACGGSSISSTATELNSSKLTTMGMKVTSKSLSRPNQGLEGLLPPVN